MRNGKEIVTRLRRPCRSLGNGEKVNLIRSLRSDFGIRQGGPTLVSLKQIALPYVERNHDHDAALRPAPLDRAARADNGPGHSQFALAGQAAGGRVAVVGGVCLRHTIGRIGIDGDLEGDLLATFDLVREFER